LKSCLRQGVRLDIQFRRIRLEKKAADVALYYGRKLESGSSAASLARTVTKSPHLIDTWKVMSSAAYGERGARPAMVLGPSFIAESPSVCTQTYLFFYVASKKQAESLQSYLNTRFFRFLVSLRKITQARNHAQHTLGFHNRHGTAFGPTRRSTRNTT
jgi:site-specific DNA-methyltransferase (adenine-specific)